MKVSELKRLLKQHGCVFIDTAVSMMYGKRRMAEKFGYQGTMRRNCLQERRRRY